MRAALLFALAGLLTQQSWESYDRTPASSAAQFIGKTRAVCGAVKSARLTGPNDKAVFELDAAPANVPVAVELSAEIRRLYGEVFDRGATALEICVLGKIEQKTTGLQLTVSDRDKVQIAARSAARVGKPTEPFAPGVLRAGAGVTYPRIKQQVNPKYTPLAMRVKLMGTVELDAVVRTDGTVGEVQVTKSLDAVFGLDDAAIQALKAWRFEPATRKGQPVEVVVGVQLEFRLH